VKIFFYSSLYHNFNPKTLGFLFPTKNSLTKNVKCEKYASEIRRDEFIDKLRKLYMNGTV